MEGSWDIFRVFNLVQEIFNRYDSWEEQLWSILRHGAGLSQMLDVSRGIFENPLLLTGTDFRYLGVTEEDYLKNQLGLQLDTQTFDVEKMATFLSLHDMSIHVREPLLLVLSLALFAAASLILGLLSGITVPVMEHITGSIL